MAFATEAELEAYTGAAVATDRATILLDTATAAIQAYTGQTLSLATSTAITLPGNYTGRLDLPERPASAPTLVKLGDTTFSEDVDYVFDGQWSLYRGLAAVGVFNATLPESFLTGYADWGGPQTQITVTYTHGFATIPNDIKGVCLALAARSLQSPDGVNSESVGSYSVSYSRTGGAVSLLTEERAMLDRYRRRVFA